jgi:fatty-acid desaturase
LAWYEIDINWITISLMEKLGLVEQVYAYSATTDSAELKPIREAA